MSFCWKRLRCLLPLAIISLGCWLAYWTFTFSSVPRVDSNRIQDQTSLNDESLYLKFENNKNFGKQIKHEAIKENPPSKVEDDYGELDTNDKEEKVEDSILGGEVKWPGDEDIYDDNVADGKKDVAVDDLLKSKLSANSNDEDEYINFPAEEEIIVNKVATTPGYNSRKDAVDSEVKVSIERVEPSQIQGNDFEREPVWRTAPPHKEREPATPFPDAYPMPRKRSNILLSITTSQPDTEKPRFSSGNSDLHHANYGEKKTSYTQSFYTMMHSGKASLVHEGINSDIIYMPDDIPSEAYIFSSNVLPSDVRLRPSVGNGRIATMIHARDVFFSGLYNGRLAESHRAAIPSSCSFNITGTDPPSNFTRYYSLNVGAGTYVEKSVSRDYNLTFKIYAHRSLTNLMVVEVDIVKFDMTIPLTLKVDLNRWTASYDLTFRSMDSNRAEVSYKVGTLNAPETSDSPDIELHVMYDHVPEFLTPSSKTFHTKWVFLTAYGTSKEEVEQSYNEGVSLIHGRDELFASHIREWGKLWNKGRVDIKGNLTLAKAAYGSFYYLLSSLPLKMDQHFKGLSPSGLALGDRDKDYQGRVMWDQEMWMFPPVLLFHPTLSAIMLHSRSRLARGAKVNADQGKLTGLLFPWESGATGVELNSDHLRGTLSPFVSAGIVFALQQLLYATNSTVLMRQFSQMITSIGHFLVSHKLSCRDNKCSVKDVLPFDDSHGVVSNSPFVNGIILNALQVISTFDTFQNRSFANHWSSFASEIIMPFDETMDFHPAYDFYKKDSVVREADAVLLGFPLLRQMLEGVRSKDLHYYESILDPRTSPMTWAMHAIGWLEVGDRVRADAAFQRQLSFIRNKFQVWSNRTLGSFHASNYLSAMGTYLQSLVNGYGGVRLHSDRLNFDPTLPANVDGMNFIGIDYLGSSVNVVVNTDEVVLVITGQLKRAVPLTLYIDSPEEVHTLTLQTAVRFRRRKFSILSAALPF